jgi:hypothetical protein
MPRLDLMIQRGIDGPDEPVRPAAQPIEVLEERRARSLLLGRGTLACPGCDAPVALCGTTLSPASAIQCPYCGHAGATRDFLSMTPHTRPARVEVRLVHRAPRIAAEGP